MKNSYRTHNVRYTLMADQAIVFVRRKAAYGIGHVGWAFSVEKKLFNAGAVENHGGTLHTLASRMGFWMRRTHDPIKLMRKRHYNEFKVIEVEHAQPALAKGVAQWVSRHAYEAIGRNCMDDVYDILRAFGVPDLPPPATHWEPNYWFDAIVGNHFMIKSKGVLLQVDPHQPTPQGPLFRDGTSLHLPFHPPPAPIKPTWRQSDAPESAQLEQSARSAPPMPAARKRDQPFLLWGLGVRLLRRIGLHA